MEEKSVLDIFGELIIQIHIETVVKYENKPADIVADEFSDKLVTLFKEKYPNSSPEIINSLHQSLLKWIFDLRF